jgi:hypothetical protein
MNTYAFHVRHKGDWGTGFGPRPTHCHKCSGALPEPVAGAITTGYGCGPSEPIAAHADAPALKPGDSLERSPAVCYACCAADDKASMIETGKFTGYLTQRADGQWYVSDWPGGLEFRVMQNRVNKSRYGGGFGAQRTDAYFIGPDKFIWHAVNRGDNQIARCKRTREQWVQLAHGSYGIRKIRK